MNRIKIRQKDMIGIFVFIVYIVLYFFVLVKYGMGNSISTVRYYLLALIVVVSLITIIINYKKGNIKNIIGKKLLLLIPLGILFIIISYFKARSVGYNLVFRTFVQTSLVILPGLYAFCIVNTFPEKKIIFLMKFTLFATIIAYFCEDNHSLFDFFKLSNWTTMTFENSFLESAICSGAFLQLYLFFKFYCLKQNKSQYNLKIYKNIAFIFSLMCFKRLGMLFVIFVALSSLVVNYNKKISKVWYVIVPIIFTFLTIYYTKFVQGNLNIFDINIYEFTTGRNYIMSLWTRTGYFSYGYGTVILVINRYLEMDLVEIYMELGILATLIFCFVYFYSSNNKLYSIIIILFGLLGLLFSSSLPSILTWILMFLNTTFLQRENNDKKNDKEVLDYETQHNNTCI